MARRKPADGLQRKALSRLGEEAGRLREKIDGLREEALRAEEAAAVSGPEPAVRLRARALSRLPMERRVALFLTSAAFLLAALMWIWIPETKGRKLA